jgi:hypothetical protein
MLRTQKDLDACLAYWQAVLGLLDWDIRARFVDDASLDGDFGSCLVDEARKTADIKIRDPKEPNPDPNRPRDPEADLLHECRHVSMWMVEPKNWKSQKGVLIEQLIERDAQLLLRLKRAASKRKK